LRRVDTRTGDGFYRAENRDTRRLVGDLQQARDGGSRLCAICAGGLRPGDYLACSFRESVTGTGWVIFPVLCSASEELWSLKKLKDLHLYRNKLTVIADEIGNMESLEKLDIGDNKIKILPKAIGNMTNVKSMEYYWDKNPLENIPEKVKNSGINAIKKYLRGN
jgi:Leucine-rich repeat (LRR) protein